MNTPITTKKNVHIPKQGDIISHLAEQKYNVGILDRAILTLFQEPKRGWVYIGKEKMNRVEFLRIIGSSRNRFKTVKLIPGETTEIFLAQLADSLNLSRELLMEEFKKKSPYREAGIIAESYNIPLSYKESRVINYLLNISKRRYKKIAENYKIPYNSKRWKDILVIASIIQKEAANNREMPLISSVIYNRLKRKMRLQMDGTLNYGKYSHIKVTPQRIKEDKSTYNTYKHKGLPNHPVCNVSKRAIISAIEPIESDYLYFMRNSRGGHDFSSSYRKHIKNIRKRQKEQNNGTKG